MSWKIEPVALSEIHRQKRQPNYGFVEQAISGGKVYRLGGSGSAGYFIVASAASLVPDFVVELSLPELAVEDSYRALVAEMVTRSSGVLWFDSTDRDSCDLAWRLGLPIRSGPPLFCWDGYKQDRAPEGSEIKIAGKAEEGQVLELLTSAPPEAGGQTREAAVENLHGGCVAVLKNGEDVLGAAVLSPLPEGYVALSSVIMQTYSPLSPVEHERLHRQVELQFMAFLGSEVAKKNVKMVYSMARQTPTGYLEAISLRMKLVKQSFQADLPGIPPAI